MDIRRIKIQGKDDLEKLRTAVRKREFGLVRSPYCCGLSSPEERAAPTEVLIDEDVDRAEVLRLIQDCGFQTVT